MPGSYKRDGIRGCYDAIVVGSGLGGLGTAALLAKHGGRRVLVLERHHTMGGFTHAFHRPGYEWDVGVHYVGDVHEGSLLRTLFDEVSGGQLAWEDIGPVYDRAVIGTEVFDFPKGRDNLRAALKARFPAEHAAIDGYFEAIRTALGTSMAYHSDKAMPGPVSAVAGPVMRHRFLQWSDRTTRQVLEGLTQDQQLIALLTTQSGDYGLPPAESSFMVHAMVANHYFGGGYYPVGGAARIAQTIEPVIEAAGGKVLVGAEVEQVAVEGGRAVGVRMAGTGEVVRAPLVISGAGIVNTVSRLLPPDAAARFDLGELRPSVGHLGLYLGFKNTADELRLPRYNLWLYPGANPEQALAASRADPEAELPVVYVSFPSAKDPDFQRRHPGRATVEVVSAAPVEWFARWDATAWKKRGADYEAFKARLAERLLEKVYAQLPQLRGQVDFQELSTPLSTRHFSNYARGEVYGLDHTPARFRQRLLRPGTPVPGLLLTGQDVVTCGLGGALFSAVLTASVALRTNLTMAIVKAARAGR